MVRINNDQGLNEAEIRQLDFRLKVDIPEGYREFLRKHNGGRPIPDCFLISEERGETDVQCFLGKRGRKEIASDIVWNKEVLTERMPKDLLPIGNDSGGNVICIGIRSHNYGKIYYWDHEFEADSDQGDIVDYSNITLVADNFQSFLDGLYEYKSEDENS